MISADLILNFENMHWASSASDRDVYRRYLRIADMGPDLGLDWVWCTEHHFDNSYAMTPDNVLILAYLAGRTTYARVATGAVILPWNDPLRVAEKVALLDNLTDGRVVFGMGRGLARTEYEGFRIPMGESRERFDEAAPMILEALETGVMKGNGPFYPQPPVEIHPTPTATFKGRTYAVGMSPDSVRVAAKLGAGLMMFLQRDVQQVADAAESYRDAYREFHGVEAPLPPVLGANVYCHSNRAQAHQEGEEYLRKMYRVIADHYEFGGAHFATTKGYAAYGEMFNGAGEDANREAADEFAKGNFVGDPDELLERLRECHDAIGSFRLAIGGGIPFDKQEASLELFSRHVLPELSKL